VDLTTREFAELGVHAVKVVAPCAVPLNADHRFPWLGHRRLYETPRWFGARRPSPEEFNPMPHPFS
jgi:ribosomal protein S12 methylthiotransferase accessory factor